MDEDQTTAAARRDTLAARQSPWTIAWARLTEAVIGLLVGIGLAACVLHLAGVLVPVPAHPEPAAAPCAAYLPRVPV